MACGRQNAPATGGQSPLLLPEAVEPARQRTQTITGELTATGIPVTYRALFTDDQLTLISETRADIAARTPGGDAEYEFKGARLLRYSGASRSGAEHIALEFDLQGALLSARGSSGDVTQEEISAIRTRAQTLRSHALTRRAVQGHGGP